MKQVLLVFLGGGIGSALRYAIGRIFNTSSAGYPWGTFSVNIIGSLLIGVFMGIALKNNNLSENQTLLLVTGLCGGFTTFSAFAYENQQFLKEGDLTSFAIYTLGSLSLGILAVFLGLVISKSF
ncbi:fluoride efflux transporter CrcB [Flavobacteriaceae bacterium]|jgi:CrcB protein|nr:fluoride efflux transporter CrcB [Flavobacteriaceae bacterium]|tara:strand:+ start:6287 stop:6658 length:372 start_codon:yes stop_codon:yes gene_type:complete